MTARRADSPSPAQPDHGETLLPGGAPAPAGPRPAARPPGASAGLPPELASHPRYRVLRELGRGGMGVVYHAEQTMMDRQVAIKVINRTLLDQPDALERFGREVRAAAKLQHPNIVIAYDAERAGDLHLLVMEFVEGHSLSEVLRRKGPLPLAHACSYVRQAALGLQHAFEKGMVHRDIKPQNLMLTPKGQVKILDFGLAKLASERGQSEMTAQGAYMGTPDYTAPEQATDARTADTRADVYSLGCALYCLLAGRPPFHEGTDVLTILAHLEKPPRPLPELRPDIPADLWAVVARMLAKDPARRYQKPAEVAQALAPFCKRASNLAPVPVAAAAPAAGSEAATVPPRDTSPPAARPRPAPPPPAPTEVVLPAARTAPARRGRRRLVVAVALFLLVLVPLGLVAGVVLGVLYLGPQTLTVLGAAPETAPTPEKAEAHAARPAAEAAAPQPPLGGGKAQRPAGKGPLPEERAWVPLFNGKDLTGWKTHPGQPGHWEVRNGVLTGSGPGVSHLFTAQDDFTNFHLRAEVRINATGNSGIFFRTAFGPAWPRKAPRWPDGFEAQINSSHPDPHRTGSLLTAAGPPGPPPFVVHDSPVPAGKWFVLEVIADGDKIALKVNDRITAEYTDHKYHFTGGRIALQQLDAQTVAEFRKIDIRGLPTAADR